MYNCYFLVQNNNLINYFCGRGVVLYNWRKDGDF